MFPIKFRTAGILMAILFLLVINFPAAHAQEAIIVNEQGCVVSASSFCDEYEDIKFNPSKAFNGKPDRPWMAGRDFNPKKGEWIRATFTKPVKLMSVRIVPGFGRTDKYYNDYPRLKKFRVVLQKTNGAVDRRTYTRHFDIEPYKDVVLLYPNYPAVKSITIDILEIYPGKKSKYAVIGNISPTIMREGKVYSSSWSVEDVITFMNSTRSSESAFGFTPQKGGKVTLIKHIRNTNPLDSGLAINKKKSYTRHALRQSWSTWATLCRQISRDYLFNSYETVSYIWKDSKTGLIMFDFTGPEYAAVMNSYLLGFKRQKVTETIEKKDERTGKKTTSTVTVLKPVVTLIEFTSSVYAP